MSIKEKSVAEEKTQNMEDRYSMPLYSKRDLVISHGKNDIIFDTDGKEYIDCIGGIGVASIGHANEVTINAIKDQAEKVITCPEIYYNETRSQLYYRLNKITPSKINRFYLCNSGTEAVEAAIKFARYTTKKTELISFMRGFHGRTIGALSITFDKKYREPFQPLLSGVNFVPLNKIAKVENCINENTAAIIIELAQGNGGVHIADIEFVQKLRKLCDDNNILLIVDEIQTGFCRTGTFFLFEQYDIIPDLVCVAKAMGSGVPIGAVLCSENVNIVQSLHGSTFGGNPLACAAANATIDFMIENRLDKEAKEKGNYFLEKLKEIDSPKIREIRGKGLLIGIQLKEKVKPYIQNLLRNGILVNSAGPTVIRLLPPLTITYPHIDEVIEEIKQVLL